MKIKAICKNDFMINDILVGIKGDILEITDAIPKETEDVFGYCDIHNLTSGKIYEATWSEAEDYDVLDIERTVEFMENRIEELKKQIKYEESKMKICGYGKSDLFYLEELKDELERLEEELDEL